MGNFAQVDESLIEPLKEANEIFKKHGYELIVKDGYRSEELYKLVKRKRYKKDGQKHTDMTFNPIRKPHLTGFTVDINLIDLKTGNEVRMWDQKDWPEGVFLDYYKNRVDVKSKKFYKLQTLMLNTMFKLGFVLGPKKEFWHFELSI